MCAAGAIRVLIVDDNRTTRKVIRAALESEGIAVVGEAGTGLEAINQVRALHPDLVTMDNEMPVMNGLEAIERIMAEHPVPILVVAAQVGVRTAFSAISKGALDVLELQAEPGAPWPALIKKVRLLAKVDITAHLAAMKHRDQPAPAPPAPPAPAPRPAPRKAHAVQDLAIVAIAASTGGPQALQVLLSHLPAFPVPIVVAQHMTSGFSKGMTEWLDGAAALTIREAEDGETLHAGAVYVNPPECSMRITAEGVVRLEEPAAHLIYHPSCDFLLKSVAKAYQGRAVAAILTGMGSDGVAGMRAVKAAGGFTLAQDEATSVVFGMNRLAVEAQCIDKVISLHDLAAELLRLALPAPW
jgi:two-component system chemotaxis response regulator CheB